MESFHVIHKEKAETHMFCLENVENHVENSHRGLHKSNSKRNRCKRMCITHPQYAQCKKPGEINTSVCG